MGGKKTLSNIFPNLRLDAGKSFAIMRPRFAKRLDSFILNRHNSRLRFGGVPERSKGADCKSAGSAFEGSNPSPSTSCCCSNDLLQVKRLRV